MKSLDRQNHLCESGDTAPQERPQRMFADIRDAAVARCGADPYLRFVQHRYRAAERGIEFDMTFPEWWEIWEPSFANRGVHKGQFVMCRFRDMGGYRSGNVRIDTVENNAKERGASGVLKAHAEAWESNPEASDWLEQRMTRGLYRPDRILAQKQEQEAEES